MSAKVKNQHCSLWGAQLLKCAKPPYHLCSSISFSRTCNIANLLLKYYEYFRKESDRFTAYVMAFSEAIRYEYAFRSYFHKSLYLFFGLPSVWRTCPPFLWKTKCPPRTFNNVKVSSFLYFLFYIALIVLTSGKLSLLNCKKIWAGIRVVWEVLSH